MVDFVGEFFGSDVCRSVVVYIVSVRILIVVEDVFVVLCEREGFDGVVVVESENVEFIIKE